jgi:hypothetical protein
LFSLQNRGPTEQAGLGDEQIVMSGSKRSLGIKQNMVSGPITPMRCVTLERIGQTWHNRDPLAECQIRRDI